MQYLPSIPKDIQDGLRVYFDTAFDEGSDSWIMQYYDNMCDPHCKAFIAFIDDAYYSSYACLLEMMSRKTMGAGGDYKEDWVKERKYGKWGSSRVCQIKNTIVVNELYGDDSVHIVKLGSVSFSYRQMYPGNDMAQILDSVKSESSKYYVSVVRYLSRAEWRKGML